jgi:hypothetical protein
LVHLQIESKDRRRFTLNGSSAASCGAAARTLWLAGARSFAPGIRSWRLNGEWRRQLGRDAANDGGAIIRLDPRATDSTQSQIAAVPCTAHNRLTDLREFGLFGVT